MHNLYDLTPNDLTQLLTEWEFATAHARPLWRHLYRDLATELATIAELPPKLLARLQAEATLGHLTAAKSVQSQDGRTNKFLLNLRDGEQIETVQMEYGEGPQTRTTACLSSQVGCALGCVFCATGQMGFTRNLTSGEIVAQALYVARRCREQGQRLSNLVLMGMGEPLLNYEAVMTALEILHNSAGLAIGAKQITISTVGVIPGIVRLADEGRKYSLAVSLHAGNQPERLAMIPAAHPWPVAELLAACRYYTEKLQQKIFFEWTLIAGKNDSTDQARELAELLQGIPCQVNLIPLNPTVGFDGQAGDTAAIAAFRNILAERQIPSSVRQRRGIEIAAGCGQLAVT
ncbi:23S rRNA (adenine(2503)-C(2))-methyltransferase RlmN [Anatilimnocola floriformis]|uniref:23S rRNA (adenine(2503)-C(2))-methyltransferase RlmN n=1 Tax=Anatilimnocola floriformis TaxID=2948575 RepID=UPI0020C1D291|nr:23S rRNA (adenine(2503)-C(2))-methyltransferase RlmN [Anatilimnocola floriformis]